MSEEVYLASPARAVAAEVHGILLHVASLENTLTGNVLAWRNSTRRQSKRLKAAADIARLVESHPRLGHPLPEELNGQLDRPREQP